MNSATSITQDVELLHELEHRLQVSNISNTALVFTFFCDVVTQHGGEVWLGNVIKALAPLNINERGVRTAVFRLVKDDWLTSRKQGRRSFYRLSDTGLNYYQRAASKIYASEKPEWDGKWILLFVAMVPDDKREQLHRGLSWLGYGRLATAVYALPGNDRDPLDELLTDLGLENNIVYMQAKADDSESMKELVLSRWQLEDLQQRYASYTEWISQVQQILESPTKIAPHTLLLLRTLLIHEYRRILLTDPELPAGMLPPDWQGENAKTQTASLYRKLYSDSAEWFERQLLADDRKTTDNDLAHRFRFNIIKAKQ